VLAAHQYEVHRAVKSSGMSETSRDAFNCAGRGIGVTAGQSLENIFLGKIIAATFGFGPWMALTK
jgi:hypothetical protein